MKKFFLCLCTLCTAASVLAQNDIPRPKLPYANEIGIRYGTQMYLGDGREPDLQAFSVDYARYNYYNIGFRTGLNVFVDADVRDYYSIPMQFTWRTGKIASAWRREQESGQRVDYYDDYHYQKTDPGSSLGAVLMSMLPFGFEVHTGFTPGMMFGPFSREPYNAGFTVNHRFSCTYDLGVRLIIPIWRFNLYGDFTYHCYLTDNFRIWEYRPSRSFMGLGGGLSFNF